MFDLFIQSIGFSVCHQLPARSLHFGDIIIPICSRCSGIYTGFFISAVILFILFRKKENDLPPLYILVILLIFFLSTIIDGIASYAGFYETNNIIRFITGFLCGASIVVIVYPIFVFQYYKNSKKEKIFRRPYKFVIFLIGLSVFAAITLFRISFLGSFYYYFSILSVIFTFYAINLVMVLLVPFFSQKATRLWSKYLILPSAISLVLVSIEIFIAFKIHQILNALQ